MLCKLKEVGLPGKVIRAIWPIIRDNFVQITTAECLSNSVTHNVGLAQGECLSPLLYSIFTHDLPAVIECQGGVKTLLYADDLAICARDLVHLQEAMNRLHTYCTDNKLAVNLGNTKTVKFRRTEQNRTETLFDKNTYELHRFQLPQIVRQRKYIQKHKL